MIKSYTAKHNKIWITSMSVRLKCSAATGGEHPVWGSEYIEINDMDNL